VSATLTDEVKNLKELFCGEQTVVDVKVAEKEAAGEGVVQYYTK
jgi:hypothetical protein